MADAVIGSLRVLLGLDTAAFTSGTKDAEKALTSFAKQTTTIAAGIGLEKFVEKATSAFAELIKASINTADEMGKMSQKIGVPVEKLTGLTVAAKLSDLGVEQLAKGMGRLDKEMVAAAAGGTSAAASAFQFLGISVNQLRTLEPDKILGLIADGMTKMADGANKTAVAVAIFGQRMGKEMIPLLNMGSKGFEEMAATAAALGLVISTQTAKQAEKFNDNMKLMGLAVQGVGNVIAAYFLPGMAKASDAMVKWVINSDLVYKSAEVIVRGIIFMSDNLRLFGILLATVFGATIVRAVASLGLAFVSLGFSIVAAAAASVIMATRFLIALGSIALVGAAVLAVTGNLDGFLKAVEKITTTDVASVGTDFVAALKSIGINVDALTKPIDGLKNSAQGVADVLKGLLGARTFNPEAAAEAKKFNDELLKLGLKARELRGDFDGLAPGFVQAAIQMKLIKDTGDGFIGTIDTLTPKMIQLNAALLNVTAGQMTKESLTVWDEYYNKINLVNMALDLYNTTSGKAGITAQTAARQSAVAWAKVVDSTGSALANAAGGFSEFFLQFSKGNKAMFAIHKAFAISQATINAFIAYTRALTLPLPPPIPEIAAAAALAAGLAMVAKIAAEKPPAMATGGSLMVGGAGGIDSKMIPIMASPGEKITVDQNKYGESSGSSRTIMLQGLSPKDYYRGDVLRDFVDNLNEAIGDGLKIKMA